MKTAFHKAAAATALTLTVGLAAGCAKDTVTGGPQSTTPQSSSTQSVQSPATSTPSMSASSDTSSADPSSVEPSASAASSSAAPSSAAPSSSSPSSPATSTPSPSASAGPAILKAGDSGDKVRELNHRLLQLDWYAGKISPEYGAATTEGVKGFQRKRGLAATGEVDQKTWDTLVSMTKQPTRDQLYNVLKAGPALYKQGASGDPVRRIQARLKQLAWYEDKQITGQYGPSTVAAVKGFQQKRQIPVTGEIDQRTLDLLVSMTRTPTAEEINNKPPKATETGSKLDPRCMTGRAMCINKDTNKLVWVVDGKPQLTLAVRFGSELTPTREGAFSVGWKSRNHVSTIYHTAMPYAMFFSGGQAVHYSADFAARGYNGASHGCVNVRDKQSIAWLFDQVKEGDKVIVYRS